MSRPKQELKFGPVGTFDPALFRKAIQALGLTFRWSRAVECPCRLTNSDQFDPTCPNCGGDGWWYVSPEEKTDRHHTRDYIVVNAAFAQATMKPNMFENFGGFDYGEAQMTVQPECRVSYRDRFIANDMEMAWTELLTRGAGTVVAVGKTGRTTVLQPQAMRYEPIRINFVADEDNNRYYQDTDWKIREGSMTEPSKMEWVTGRGPAAGKRYTVHYVARPVFIVDDAVYAMQGLSGPDETLKGIRKPQVLPTTFKVKLDFLTQARGS